MGRAFQLTLVLSALATTAGAQAAPIKGWADCGHGGSVGRDTVSAVDGKYVLVLTAPQGNSAACVRQALDARPYRGLYVYFEGAVRGWSSYDGGIWIDAASHGEHRLAQMSEETDPLSLYWHHYRAWLLVPEDADTLYVGASTFGHTSSGALWVDDLTFWTESGPHTQQSSPPPPPFPQAQFHVDRPVNLSFEER